MKNVLPYFVNLDLPQASLLHALLQSSSTSPPPPPLPLYECSDIISERYYRDIFCELL